MAKSRDRNKKCSACKVKYSPRLDACPKCGWVEPVLTKQPKVRKPLKGGNFLNR